MISWGKDAETQGASHATPRPKLRVRSKAKRLAKTVLSEGAGKEGARAFKVDESRFSHWKHDDEESDPASRFFEAIMAHPSESAARAYVAGAESALESRRFYAKDTSLLLTELFDLWEAEHQLDMGEDREGCLFMAGGNGAAYYAALRKHGSVQLRLAELLDELEHRPGINIRALLLENSEKHTRRHR